MAPHPRPRFLQRMEQAGQLYRTVFGEQANEPPPYAHSLRSEPESDVKSTNSKSSAPPEYVASAPSHPYIDTPENMVLPKNSLILVTGANSFHGMHIVDQLVVRGFRVRGTVRDDEKAKWTTGFFSEKYGRDRYHAVVIADMVDPENVTEAVRGCVGIIHLVSATALSQNLMEVVIPTRRCVEVLLNAAASEKGGRTVRRFVFCSATTAAVDPDIRSHIIDHQCFNESTMYQALSGLKRSRGIVLEGDPEEGVPMSQEDRRWSLQCASKTHAEQVVWEWEKFHKPDFVINCVLPATLWGSRMLPQQRLPTSMLLLKAVMDGNAASMAWYPAQHFIHVLDSALLHVAALTLPNVQGKRIFAVAAPWSINSILDTLRDIHPDRDIRCEVRDHGVDRTTFVEKAYAARLLRNMGKPTWTTLEETLREATREWT